MLCYFIFCIYMHYIHKAFSKTVTQRLNFANILPADGQNWIHDVVSHGHLNRADIHVDIDFHMSTQPSTSPKCLSCQAPEWCPIFESLKCSSRHNSPHGFVLKVSHPIFFAINTAWTNTIQHVIAVSDAEQHPDCVSTIWRWTKSQGHPKSHCM